jgi:hypothetical protein
LIGDLHHWQYDTFVARWRDRELRADAFVTFMLGPEGRIERAAPLRRRLSAHASVDVALFPPLTATVIGFRGRAGCDEGEWGVSIV